MGQPHTVVDAKQFLRRGEASVPTVRNPAAVGVAKRSTSKDKPTVPRRDEKPVMGLVSQKNYITANAVDNILAVPKKPVSNDVNYLQKQDYGQVPQYLSRVKQQITEEYRMIEEMTQSNQPQNEDEIEMLTDGEREKLLEGLKANWATINKDYQTLSFTLDTPAKKKRKVCTCCAVLWRCLSRRVTLSTRPLAPCFFAYACHTPLLCYGALCYGALS